MEWKDLDFFHSVEWETIQERLDDLDARHFAYNPKREHILRPFDSCPFDSVRCVFMGQDPYPNPDFACGLSFSIPRDTKASFSNWPPTLLTLFDEYEKDLHYSIPTSGDLSDWASQGVLLMNVYPTCASWRSMSHAWKEWTTLTQEVVEKLSRTGVVFVFLDGVAREYSQYVGLESRSICVSHPSPRASGSSRNPFLGSRIFTTVNGYLKDLGKAPINWKLL